MLAPVNLVARQVPSSRHDVYAADLQDQEEVDDRARDRYQRLFWEPVGESEVMFFSLLFYHYVVVYLVLYECALTPLFFHNLGTNCPWSN